MALWRKTAIFLFVLTLATPLLRADEPSLDDTDIVETGATASVTIEVYGGPEATPRYNELRDEMTRDFNESAGIDSEDAFEAWVEDPRNSGLTTSFLTRYAASSLRSLKAELRDGMFLRWLFESQAGMDREDLARLLNRKIDRMNRDVERERQRIGQGSERLRRELEDAYESEREGIEVSLRNIEIQQEGIMLAHQRFARLSLEEIADDLDGTAIGRFFSGFDSDMSDLNIVLRDAMEQRSNNPAYNVADTPNIMGDLTHRINFIRDSAANAYGEGTSEARNKGNKYVVAYVVSWFLSGLSSAEVAELSGEEIQGSADIPGSIDRAIAIVEGSAEPDEDPPSEGEEDEGPDADNEGGASAPDGDLQQSDLSREQQEILLAFTDEVVEHQSFESPDIDPELLPLPEDKSKEAFFRHFNHLTYREVREGQTNLLEYDAKIEMFAEEAPNILEIAQQLNHPLLPEVEEAYREFERARSEAQEFYELRESRLNQMQRILQSYNIDVDPREIDDVEAIQQVLLRLSRAGIGESARQEFAVLLSESNLKTAAWFQRLRVATQAYSRLREMALEMGEDEEEGPSEKLQEILSWIEQFNENRGGLREELVARYGTWYTQGDEVAQSYSHAARNLLRIVETSFADQKRLFNASLQPHPGSASFTQCASYVPDFSVEDLAYPTESMHSAVSSIEGDIDTEDEKRLVCLAGYEYEMKGLNPDYELFKMRDGSPDSFGFRTVGVINSMSSARSSVSSADTAEHSLMEGLYENLAFMRDLNDYLVGWIRTNLENNGVQVREGGGSDSNVRGESANQIALRLGDTVLFDHDESVINASGQDVLNRVGDAFTAVLDTDELIQSLFEKISIEGHASPPGPRSHNMGLSEDRAEAVLQGIRDRNIPIRLDVQAFGEGKPIDGNGDLVEYPEDEDWNRDYPDGLDEAACRRVEFAFSINMREIEEILQEKGDRYHRLRRLIAEGSDVEAAGDGGDVDPDPIEVEEDPADVDPSPSPDPEGDEEDEDVSPSPDPEGDEDEETVVDPDSPEVQTLRTEGLPNLDGMLGYLETSGWEDDNEIFYDPLINNSDVQLHEEAAASILQTHDQLLAVNPEQAQRYWNRMGKYFETPRGSLGEEVDREAGQEMVPRKVDYTVSGPRNRRTYTNPAIADLRAARIIAAEAAGVQTPAHHEVDLEDPQESSNLWQHTAIRRVEQWEAYLDQTDWEDRENDVWHNPGIAANHVALREEVAADLIDMHNIVIIRSEADAQRMWDVMGRYFENSEGQSGVQAPRTSVSQDYEPNTVAYDYETERGPSMARDYTNPIQEDLRELFEVVRSISF